ncbi:hypothetical protein SSX86_000191 [Deinandra increscens subsp. villosa]|uniref:J domain-containing protein n=1 Tax=Deinandra increscens subsp. villosa TaxID=3103831 RepID=A0AAP0DW65_9ASTR
MWTSARRNYGENTTNRAESEHHALKSHLRHRKATLDQLVGFIDQAQKLQLGELKNKLATSRIKTMSHHAKIRLFDRIRGRVSIKCLDLLYNEINRLHTVLKVYNFSCGHQLYTGCGIPCACRLERMLDIPDYVMPLEYIDLFWRKLDYKKPAYPGKVDDYEGGDGFDPFKDDSQENADTQPKHEQSGAFDKLKNFWKKTTRKPQYKEPENLLLSPYHSNSCRLSPSPMATKSENPKSPEPSPSVIQAYWFPAILFCASMFFQLVAIPRSFPPSHYDALGIRPFSSIEQVNEAYQQLSSDWKTVKGPSSTLDRIKLQYAYELLSNPIWKRDYDIFGIDEHLHIMEKVKETYSNADFSDISLPLLEPTSSEPDQVFDVISSENYVSKIQNSNTLLLQVFSVGSSHCAQFSNSWKRIAGLLDGITNTGMVEIGDLKLATYLSEKKYTGVPFFRNGLPSLVAFPPGCKTSDCIFRYTGQLSVDAVTDWFATNILSLPRISYYSIESLAQTFLGKGSRHKVKVIFISKTGQRATPFVRHVAKSYWSYASFAFTIWREEDSVFWSNTFGVEEAPAIVILRDPGVKPVVYHGVMNNSRLIEIMEQNKHQVLPQLRSVTSMELGCDPKGYSRAGNDTTVWYCAVIVGRQSAELHKMRETMRSVQEMLSNDGDVDQSDNQKATSAAVALKEKRLTFAWVDGEVQKITQWISETIRDGDSRDLPFHLTSTPELVPEDVDPIWSKGREQIVSSSRGMKQRIQTIGQRINDLMGDPRFGPMLLLGALMSFGFIYLRRNQSIKLKESDNASHPKHEGADGSKPRRRRPKRPTNQNIPPSLTDMEPPNAFQMPFTDTDSD